MYRSMGIHVGYAVDTYLLVVRSLEPKPYHPILESNNLHGGEEGVITDFFLTRQ